MFEQDIEFLKESVLQAIQDPPGCLQNVGFLTIMLCFVWGLLYLCTA